METPLMPRRDFLAASATVAVAASSIASTAEAAHRRARSDSTGASSARPGDPFHLSYAPHFGMFGSAGDDIAQLEFAAANGFAAWEDNGMMGRSAGDQEKIARAMERLGIRMGVFVANPGTIWGQSGLATADSGTRDKFLAELHAAVDVAKRVNAKWMTVVPGTKVDHLEPDFQTANVIEALKRGAEIFEPHGLVMVLEALNPWRDHPGLFLSKIPQAYLLCKAVDSPAVKILFDMYHQQITEGNIIPNIDHAWDQIGYFQIGDNPGRNEPGTGEMNYHNIFRHIHDKGFTGILGMEHGNSRPGKDGEAAVISAYRSADSF